MNLIRDEISGNKDWRNKDGRPVDIGTPQSRVQEWRPQHPEGRKADCHRDTGHDPKTIRKWWNCGIEPQIIVVAFSINIGYTMYIR